MAFDKAFLEEMKQKLQEAKQHLEDELAKIGKRSSTDAADFKTTWEDYGDKEDDNAAEVAAYSDSLGLEATLEPELRDVLDALVRIDSGTYGMCKMCGAQIALPRLHARPMASLCIACQEKSGG